MTSRFLMLAIDLLRAAVAEPTGSLSLETGDLLLLETGDLLLYE